MNKLFFLICFSIYACQDASSDQSNDIVKPLSEKIDAFTQPYVTVLGIAQDAGYPQIGCTKACCKDLWATGQAKNLVSCIAVVDPKSQEYWIFDATPDFKYQLANLNEQILGNYENINLPSGIFLTHAHVGHYTGLMDLGRETYGAKDIPVYCLPKMSNYLKNNGPWSQLVDLENIEIRDLNAGTAVEVSENLRITAYLVPHRDEFSETAGYVVEGRNKKVLFIPDINKWQLWEKDIVEVIREVDIAFLDGSFYKNGELVNRDMSEIPHPFIEESMNVFQPLSAQDRAKVYFIHFNHTNPVLRDDKNARKEIEEQGYQIAFEGLKIGI